MTAGERRHLEETLSKAEVELARAVAQKAIYEITRRRLRDRDAADVLILAGEIVVDAGLAIVRRS